jgi:hypothetical protein
LEIKLIKLILVINSNRVSIVFIMTSNEGSCKELVTDLRDLINRNKASVDANKIQSEYYSIAHETWRNRKSLHQKDLDNFNKRIGKYKQYEKHGVSEDFTIEWGYVDADTTSRCRECAKRQLENGWWQDGNGKMAKNAGVAWQDIRCSLTPGDSLLGWDGYEDSNDGRWGWQSGHAGSRKWWTCDKSDSKKAEENRVYNLAKPTFNENEPQDEIGVYAHTPIEPLPTSAINCCTNIMNIMNITGSVEDNIQTCYQEITQSSGAPGTPGSPTVGTPTPDKDTTAPGTPGSPTVGTPTPDKDTTDKDTTDTDGTPTKLAIFGGIGGLLSSSSFMVLIILLLIFLM